MFGLKRQALCSASAHYIIKGPHKHNLPLSAQKGLFGFGYYFLFILTVRRANSLQALLCFCEKQEGKLKGDLSL